VKRFGGSVNLAFYGTDIGVPDMIGTSMRMAYIVSKPNSLFANSTLCHDYTSLINNMGFPSIKNPQHLIF
jgi:hypothetical protein